MKEIIAALVGFHQEVTAIPRDGENPHFRSRYATLEAVLSVVRAPLAARGLVLVQGVAPSDRGVEVVTTLYHTSGEELRNTVTVSPRDGSPQAVGSAITYGRRYGIMALLCLATEDDDGNAAQPAPRTERSDPPAQNYRAGPPCNPGAQNARRTQQAIAIIRALWEKGEREGKKMTPLPEGWEHLPYEDIVAIGKALRMEVEGGDSEAQE